MNLSYHLDVPSGTTIVLVGAAIFGIVLAVTGGRTLRRTRDLDDVVDLSAGAGPLPERRALSAAAQIGLSAAAQIGRSTRRSVSRRVRDDRRVSAPRSE